MTNGPKPNILLVDDTPANLGVMKQVLESLELNIFTAGSGNEALTLLLHHEFAVVLLDVQMSDMSGLEVAELMMMHEEIRFTPIIFVTAMDKDDKIILEGYEVGAVDYIFKPFDRQILKSKVMVFLNLYNQKAELSNILNEKEKLISQKDALLCENLEQKNKLKNYFKFKMWTSIGALSFIAIGYTTYISFKNTQLLTYTEELNALNSYTNRLNEAYQKFIPYDILNLLNKESITEVHLGDQVCKEMIVLFVDVRAYSAIAEQLTPEENITLINKLLKMMEEPITAHKGIINKYLGDGLMALFYTSADDALNASITMIKNFARFSQKRMGEEKPAIRIGIGIDEGKMIVGTVGTENRMEQTVVADAVNVASRIEGMTKIYGTSLLISENIYRNLKDPARYAIRLMDTVRVQGRKKPVVVYQVLDGECEATVDLYRQTMQHFSEGMLLFRERKFSAALRSFQKVLKENPDDSAAKIYCERCKKYMQNPPSNEEWSHIMNLSTK